MARPAVLAALLPPPGDRHGPLVPMLIVLTLLTGVVDAVSYLELGHVFVANMTGNVVFLGFAIAGAPGLSVASSLIALAAFLARRPCRRRDRERGWARTAATCCAARARCSRCSSRRRS